jgi:hypothetical protein
MLQNGKIAFRCIAGRGGGLRSTYVLAMTVMGSPSTGYSAAENTLVPEIAHQASQRNSSSATRINAKSSSASFLPASRGGKPNDPYVFYSPLAVHANFVMDKIGALHRNGLWLIPYSDKGKDKGKGDLGVNSTLLVHNKTYHQHQHQDTRQLMCKPFHIAHTTWGDIKRMNWTQEIIDAKKDRELQQSLSDGACVRFPLRKTIFIVQNKTARALPDGDTFERYGCKWNNITTVSWQFIDLPEGGPIPGITTNSTSSGQHEKKNTKIS